MNTLVALAINTAVLLTPTSKIVQKLNPVLDTKYTKFISDVIDDKSERYGIDKIIAISILFRESGFNPNPRRCHVIRERCVVDIGVSQINFKVWGKYLKLDRKRLIYDIEYNIDIMFKILVDYKRRYKREKQWYTRYHSGTPKYRRIYTKKIDNIMKQIKLIEKGE